MQNLLSVSILAAISNQTSEISYGDRANTYTSVQCVQNIVLNEKSQRAMMQNSEVKSDKFNARRIRTYFISSPTN